jgi:energy-coupling factor transporter ATP-binding protein EcfA2
MPKTLSYGYQNDRQLVETLSRRDFLIEFRRDYADGHHVTGIGPSGKGKSTLFYQCLAQVISPERQVVSLHGKLKGRDPTIPKAANKLHLRIVPEMPGKARREYDKKRKYNGYIIRPLESPGSSVAAENELLADRFGEAIHHCYVTPPGRKIILHVNEAHQTQVDLKLKTECEGPLMRGAPDCAEWSEIQRGRNVSYMCYDSAEHMFIFKDDDTDNVKRYSDFGQGDPYELRELMETLQTERSADGRTISQCLYIRRGGGMYVVDT